MGVIPADQVKRFQEFPGVNHEVYVNQELGSGSTTLGFVTIEPGAGIPPHRHKVEDCMIVLAGEAELMIDGNTSRVSAGSGIVVPAGALHAIQNTGSEPFKICFTWPSVHVERLLAK